MKQTCLIAASVGLVLIGLISGFERGEDNTIAFSSRLFGEPKDVYTASIRLQVFALQPGQLEELSCAPSREEVLSLDPMRPLLPSAQRNVPQAILQDINTLFSDTHTVRKVLIKRF